MHFGSHTFELTKTHRMENKPTLVDSDVRTNGIKKSKASIYSLRLSTVAIALSLTTASMTITSCSDSYDTTSYADPAADSYDNASYDVTDADPYDAVADSYDLGQYDTNDSDVTNTAD